MSAISRSSNTDLKSLSLVSLYTAPGVGLVGYSLFKLNTAKDHLFRFSQHGWMKRSVLGFGLGLCYGATFGSARTIYSIGMDKLPWIPKMEKCPELEDLLKMPSIVCLGGPVVEEVCFRGCLLPIFIRAIGQTNGIMAVSALFGFSHLSNIEDDGKMSISTHPQRIAQAVNATVTGVLLGYIYVYFGLFTAIGVHIGNNTSAYTIHTATAD